MKKKKVKVVLSNLGFRRTLSPWATPPMGLLSIASYLRSEMDVEIRIINQRLDNLSIEELAKEICDFTPNIIGLSTLTTFSYLIDALSRIIKERCPGSWIVVGGPHASSVRSGIFNESDNIDIVVPGEGEIALKCIAESYPDQNSLKNIPGIIWKSKDEEIIENLGYLPIVEDLDKLPFPAYDLIDLSKYWKRQSATPIPFRKYASIVSSRGCPYQCIWCHKIFGRKIRMYSAGRIVEEIEYLKNKFGINDFEFLDDNFNFNTKRVFEFADLVTKKGLKIYLSFPNGIRGDLVGEDVADAFYALGTYMCSFALETGSPRLQKFSRKNLNIPKLLKAIDMMAKKRIYANGFCTMGFPTETEEELQLTIDVANESSLHTSSFSILTPLPGTPLYKWVEENKPEKLKNINYADIDFISVKINLTDLPDQVLFKYQRKATRKFYSNPKRIVRIIRDYPKPFSLIEYIPIYVYKITKGFLGI